MSENVTNELLLEHLKRIQNKLSEHDDRFSRLEGELRARRIHRAARAIKRRLKIARDLAEATRTDV